MQAGGPYESGRLLCKQVGVPVTDGDDELFQLRRQVVAAGEVVLLGLPEGTHLHPVAAQEQDTAISSAVWKRVNLSWQGSEW